ncbi:MAG: S24 family peptidase [Bacteroidota bacterium]
MQSTLDRIKQYLDLKDISVRAFEQSLEFSNGAFASQLKNNKTIGVDKVENILRKYEDLNPSWLLTGKGEMLLNNVTELEATNTYILKTDKNRELQKVPLYDMQAAASLTKVFNGKPNIIDYISVPNLPKCDGAISITGDSMYPLLKSGDIVMYKVIANIEEGIFWGEIYLLSVKIDGEFMTLVKYVQKSDLGQEYINLVSYNSHHSPKDVKIKHISAMALVKASIRINSMN